MIVPTYWAEARVRDRTRDRQVTVRRFGWSDSSQEDAQRLANERAKEALARALSDKTVERRERKVPYNGAHGVPIREEIVRRHDQAIITRNSYGARCLNTPNVLFADIDFEREPSNRVVWIVVVVLLLATLALAWAQRSWLIAIMGCIAVIPFGFAFATPLKRLAERVRGGAEKLAHERIREFIRTHGDWHLRVYRTPAGLRVLAMHGVFDPTDAVVAECFRALGTDPLYARMCERQCCFRARVSPKPWRIGIGNHLRPRPGVWPVNPARLAERKRWIDAYEAKATQFASCRFVEALGSKRVDATASAVQRVHDELCRASSNLPLA